jgi:hypothetical protein
MNIPDRLPMLHVGFHEEGDGELCAMEAAAWLAGEEHSDTPACVHPMLAQAVRIVNDVSNDDVRQTLWPLIIRCLGTASDDKMLAARLAVWSARYVLEFVDCREPGPVRVVEAAEAWADCPCEDHACDVSSVSYDISPHGAPHVIYSTTNASSDLKRRGLVYGAAYKVTWAISETYWPPYAEDKYNDGALSAVAAAAIVDPGPAVLIGLLDEYDRLTGRTQYTEPTAEAWDKVLIGGSA